jgi:hypothetical protein
MTRALRLSARPFVVFGVIFGVLAAFVLYVDLTSNRHTGLLNSLYMLVPMYGVLVVSLSSVRVSVQNDGILIRRWFVATQFVPFSTIDHSDVQYLAERDWPVSVAIHLENGTSVSLGMKVIRQTDAAWFCALPQLKSRIHRGLTNAA